MIKVIEGNRSHEYPEIMDQMFQLRSRVFKERLNWDVSVIEGREIDHFDTHDPLYIVSIDENTGRVNGSLRLMHTTGPNMLRDVFSELLPSGEIVESPLIWESSRFCIDPLVSEAKAGRVNRITAELLCGIIEIGMQVGLEFIVSVYDARMARVFQRANCPAEIIGTPKRIGKVLTYAGLFDISQELWNNVALSGGVTKPVISPSSHLNSVSNDNVVPFPVNNTPKRNRLK